MNATPEEWRWIAGYEGLYEVSDLGCVRSHYGRRGGRVLLLKPKVRPGGHLSVTLWKNKKARTRLIHQLVLESFVGPRPEGMLTRHLDGHPENNALPNLSYGTHSENLYDSVRHGTHKSGRERTHCKHGHEFTDENTYWHWNGRAGMYLRTCRACCRIRTRQRRARADAA